MNFPFLSTSHSPKMTQAEVAEGLTQAREILAKPFVSTEAIEHLKRRLENGTADGGTTGHCFIGCLGAKLHMKYGEMRGALGITLPFNKVPVERLFHNVTPNFPMRSANNNGSRITQMFVALCEIELKRRAVRKRIMSNAITVSVADETLAGSGVVEFC